MTGFFNYPENFMPWYLIVVYLAAGIALLYYGAEFLVKGGVKIAYRFKISPLVVGLTLVAFGTSAPELVVSIDSALKGLGNISIGNVVGSNICNIALILGLCSMITPLNVNKQLFRLDVPLMIISAVVLSIFCIAGNGVNRWQGAVFFAGIIAYTVYSIRFAGKNDSSSEDVPENSGSLLLAVLLVAGGLAALICGSKLFVNSAVYIAKLLKISDAVIGLTVVAVGTSLPELATSVVAAIRGEKDIAIGNVVGSNIFNILAICGIAPLVAPISCPGISMVDMVMMLAVSGLLWIMMKTGLSISRKEGALLFLIYCGYTVYLLVG